MVKKTGQQKRRSVILSYTISVCTQKVNSNSLKMTKEVKTDICN